MDTLTHTIALQVGMTVVQSHRIRREGRGGLAVDAFFAMACAAHVLAVADAWANVDLEGMGGHMRCYQMAIVGLSTLLFLLFMCTHRAPSPGHPEDEKATVPPSIASLSLLMHNDAAIDIAGAIARSRMHLFRSVDLQLAHTAVQAHLQETRGAR